MLVLLGVPVLIAVMVLRHFNRKDDKLEREARMLEKIQELEERIERLEEL